MQQELTRLVARCAAIWLMSAPGWSVASDNSATVFPAEGNKTCSDYSSNKLILSMGTTAPTASPDGIQVFGTENPRDGDSIGESAKYILSPDGKSLSFLAATTPIDYVVMKSGTNVTVIIYPAGGVTADANMVLPGSSGNLTISTFNLCYGLVNQTPPPPPPAVTKSCNISAVLDATGVACPANGQRTLVCNIELDKPFYGLNDGSDSCCVCNHANDELAECDPNVTYDPNNPDPRACTTGDKTGAEVTTSIEINKDPYYCTTVGGTRKCYSY